MNLLPPFTGTKYSRFKGGCGSKFTPSVVACCYNCQPGTVACSVSTSIPLTSLVKQTDMLLRLTQISSLYPNSRCSTKVRISCSSMTMRCGQIISSKIASIKFVISARVVIFHYVWLSLLSNPKFHRVPCKKTRCCSS